jgi:hypothetical protein
MRSHGVLPMATQSVYKTPIGPLVLVSSRTRWLWGSRAPPAQAQGINTRVVAVRQYLGSKTMKHS